MTSRRVGRPCAKTAKPKTIKIKIKKEPVKKARKVVRMPPPLKKAKKAVRMPPPLKPIKIKKEIPRLKKARKPVRMPPPLMSKMAKVKLLNSNNALKKENVKRAKDEKNSKQRESIRKRLLSQQDDIKATVKRVNAQNELRLKLEKEFEKKQKNMLKNQADSKSFFAQRKIDIEKKRKAPTFLEVLEGRKFNTKKMSFADIAKLK
jgi:hypothetical protein